MDKLEGVGPVIGTVPLRVRQCVLLASGLAQEIVVGSGVGTGPHGIGEAFLQAWWGGMVAGVFHFVYCRLLYGGVRPNMAHFVFVIFLHVCGHLCWY